MRRKVTKAAALLSAVLMASSSVPYGVLIPYNVLAEEVSADAGVAAGNSSNCRQRNQH